MTILNQQSSQQTNNASAFPADLHNLEEAVNIKNFNKEPVVLPLGQNNPMHQLRVGTDSLNSSDAEDNLGIIMDAKVNESKQHARIVSKAKCILGCIRNCKASRLREVLTPCIHQWGHTEYWIQFWGSQIKRGVERLERVQWRAIETS